MFFHNSSGRKVGATVLLIVLTLGMSASLLFGAARPARAQYVDPVTSIQTTLSNIWSKITDALVEGVSVALANAANYFMSQLAYQIAVGIVSGCPGQKSCTVTSFLGDAVKGAAQGALGEALGSLSKAGGFEALGINLCAPPSAQFGLSIQLGLLNEAKPPAPKCDFSQVMSNWKTAAASLSPSELQKNVWQGFKPGASPIGMSFHATEKIKADVGAEQSKAMSEQLAKMSGAGGFQDVTDMVTKKVRTPAAAVKAEFERGQREKYEYPKIFQQIQNAGQQARGSVWGAILLNAAQTFGQTLLAQLWNKLVNKIFASQDSAPPEETPELIMTEEGVVTTGKSEQEEALAQTTTFGAGNTPVPMTDVGVIDPMSQFSICPDTGRGQWNCIVDTQLASAVRLGNSMPVTVAEAIEKGYLHAEWPLISATDKAKNSSDQCFSSGYCQGNLAKLRAARILSVGWEIAASLSSKDNPYKLKDALDNFDNQSSPLYHLIDPGWVLKQPLTQCKAQVFSSMLVSPEIARRAQICVDAPTCLREDDYGTCVGGWGYCTRERNVWRFNGDSCPEQYNTCRTLKSRAGQNVNYITNTIDRSTCSASNIGCRRYATGLNAYTCTLTSVCNATSGGQPISCPCTLPNSVSQCQVAANNRSCLNPMGEMCVLGETQCIPVSPATTCTCTISYSCSVPNGAISCSTIVGNADEKGDDWMTSPARFFNKNAKVCSVDKNGCTQLVKFGKGQSLNLVKNGSFEDVEDADSDGEPDHARNWSPFGLVPASGLAATIRDVTLVVSGSASARVGATPATAATACTLNPSTAVCTQSSGCICPNPSGTPYATSPSSSTSKCLIAKGESGCSMATRLVQNRLQVAKDRTYTLSGSFRRERCYVNQGSTTCSLPTSGTCTLKVCSGGTSSGQACTTVADCTGSGASCINATACGSASATWKADLSKCYCATSGSATMRLSFMDGIAQLTKALTSTETSTVLKNGTSCSVTGGNIELVANVGIETVVSSCSFLTNADISNATLEIYGSNALADDIILEEGGGTDYHDGYGAASETAYAKVAPDYLGCTGEDTDRAECKSFARVCRDSEVGCDMYSPASGDPSVPGIVGPTDYCPAECDGYDVFKQAASEFERLEKFPVYFIPATAKACLEEESGCSEFTDILTEEVAYYSKLRMCQLPDAADNQVFYSWEGSDTTGYQLKVWNLKRTNRPVLDEAKGSGSCSTDADCTTAPLTACRGGVCVNPKPADVCADLQHVSCKPGVCSGGTNAGNPCGVAGDCPGGGSCSTGSAVAQSGSAPCTQVYYSGANMVCMDKVCNGGANKGKACSADSGCPSSTCVTNTEGRCSKADIDAGNFDCREFYDEFGNRHYRLLTKTIVATTACRRYRITDALQNDCDGSNGKWDDSKKECAYLASLSESTSCAAQSKGCRTFKGNTATNVNIRLTDTYESGVDEWKKKADGTDNMTGGTYLVSQSSESINVGGHSLKITSGATVYRDISGLASTSRSYTLTFWARGSGLLKIAFANWTGGADTCSVTKCAGADCRTCTLPNGLSCVNAAGTAAEGSNWSCTVLNMASYFAPPYVTPAVQPPEYVPFSDKVFRCTNDLTRACTSDSNCVSPGRCAHADYRCSNDVTKACRTAADCTGAANCLRISLLRLGSDWRQYTVGPVIVSNNAYFGKAKAGVIIETDSVADTYVDNFVMKEVQDNIFVVRDSWQTPASCDQALDGSPAPLEMLGCRKYTDTANQPLYLRTFSKLCREQAIGCAAYSNLQNTSQSSYEESFNAVCSLSSICVPGSGMANCICNYKLDHPAANTTYRPVLADVCRVQAGEKSCRFHLNGQDTYASRSAYADIAFIPADRRVNLVVSPTMSCQATDGGCRTFGTPTIIYEGTCSMAFATSNGTCNTQPNCPCTDAKTGLSCKIQPGESSCKFSTERPITKEWKAVAFKDDPATYEQTLCRDDEVGCESYTAKDGVWYFKDPGNATCEYKDTATIEGVTRAGWFRKSESGGIFPCYPELLREGKFFEINRNKDKFCALSSKCLTSTGCMCYDQTNPTVPVCRVVEGGTVCGYRGWVGICDAKYNYCEEFVDPLATTAAHPEGEPYYYIVNNKLDQNSCAGTVSLKQGCVLFNQTSVASKLYSAPATYARAVKDTGGSGGKVNSLNCDTLNRSDLCKRRCVSYRNAYCHKPCSSDSDCTSPGKCSTAGTCSNYTDEGKECFQDTECSGHAASGGTCSSGSCINSGTLNGRACTFDADCKKVRCTGNRVYGLGCTSTVSPYADCNAAVHEICVAEPTENQPLLRKITQNDTNVILKVRRDRECAEWLTCSRESTTWDDDAKKFKSTCTDFTSCSGSSQLGQVMECVNFIEPPIQKLTKDVYKVRDVTWAGLDYSGYSLPNKYPVQYLAPVKVFQTGNTSAGVCTSSGGLYDGAICNSTAPGATCGGTSEGAGICSVNAMAIQRYGVKIPLSTPCQTGTTCTTTAGGSGGTCYQGYCYYNLDGGGLDLNKLSNGPTCRAYPESDSPFGPTILTDGAKGYDQKSGTPVKYSANFKGANVCTMGNYCECGYTRVTYGKNQGLRFYSDLDKAAKGICSGGGKDGEACDPEVLGPDNFCKKDLPDEDKGICVKKTNVMSILGWPGFCIDNDSSISVNNSEAQQACNLWLPVDALAGMPNRYNQFREAGFYFDDVSDLNYCTNADGAAYGDGNPPSDTYTNTWTPTCGDCLNRAFDGKGGGGDDESVKNWPINFAWISPNKTWSISQARRHRVDKFEVRLDDDDCQEPADVNTGNDSVLALSASNNWTVVVDFDSLSTTPQTFTTNNGNNTCGSLLWDGNAPNDGNGSGGPTYYWFKEWSDIENITNVDCVGAKLIWSDYVKADGNMIDPNATGDNAYPVALRTAMAHQRDNDYCFDAGSTVFFRESCREFVNVKGGANIAVSRTSNMYEAKKAKEAGGSYIVSGMNMGNYWTWDSTSTAVIPKAMSPFGHASPISAPSGGRMTIAQSEGGTDWNAPASSALALSCTGYCNLTESSNKGSSAATSYGRPRLSSMYAKFYSIKTSTNGTSFTSQPATTVDPYDKRSTLTGSGNVPQIRPVDTQNCYDTNGTLLCKESAKAGFTVNDNIDTDVRSQRDAGRLKVSLKYYAYADPDHMPIRWKAVDFGDGSVIDGSPGYYKNHRGGTGTGKLTPICKILDSTSADTWGLTDASCEPRYFEDAKTYICNQGKLAQIRARYPTGNCAAVDSTDEFYPCEEDGACVFRPRVQLIDNWGFCNGNCPGGNGQGSTCMNNELAPENPRIAGDECNTDLTTTGTKKPWTWFSKRIFVYPSPK